VDRIARVTLWTDHAYPVIAFNVYLTGYDVQAINLFDVIQRGIIAPDAGTGTTVTSRGAYSDPNHEIDVTGCSRLPGALDPFYVTRMRSAFTLGVVGAAGSAPGCTSAGGVHDDAVGYATIDLVRTCSSHLPTEPQYWTEDIAFENVLIGDYQQLDSANNFAQSNSMVHIRAVPGAGFPRTFYSRYQAGNNPRLDARQPLPSTFAARWIQGGTGSFQTSYKIWREAKTPGTSCGEAAANGLLSVGDIVRFDEAENGVADVPVSIPIGPPLPLTLPATSRTNVADFSVYPQLTNGAVAGWVYLNLDACTDPLASCAGVPFASQNWVVTSMRAAGRYSGDMDATALGNGCSPPAPLTEAGIGTAVIGPAGNVNP
jgi:hypothetical protein